MQYNKNMTHTDTHRDKHMNTDIIIVTYRHQTNSMLFKHDASFDFFHSNFFIFFFICDISKYAHTDSRHTLARSLVRPSPRIERKSLVWKNIVYLF